MHKEQDLYWPMVKKANESDDSYLPLCGTPMYTQAEAQSRIDEHKGLNPPYTYKIVYVHTQTQDIPYEPTPK